MPPHQLAPLEEAGWTEGTEHSLFWQHLSLLAASQKMLPDQEKPLAEMGLASSQLRSWQRYLPPSQVSKKAEVLSRGLDLMMQGSAQQPCQDSLLAGVELTQGQLKRWHRHSP